MRKKLDVEQFQHLIDVMLFIFPVWRFKMFPVQFYNTFTIKKMWCFFSVSSHLTGVTKNWINRIHSHLPISTSISFVLRSSELILTLRLDQDTPVSVIRITTPGVYSNMSCLNKLKICKLKCGAMLRWWRGLNVNYMWVWFVSLQISNGNMFFVDDL